MVHIPLQLWEEQQKRMNCAWTDNLQYHPQSIMWEIPIPQEAYSIPIFWIGVMEKGPFFAGVGELGLIVSGSLLGGQIFSSLDGKVDG